MLLLQLRPLQQQLLLLHSLHSLCSWPLPLRRRRGGGGRQEHVLQLFHLLLELLHLTLKHGLPRRCSRMRLPGGGSFVWGSWVGAIGQGRNRISNPICIPMGPLSCLWRPATPARTVDATATLEAILLLLLALFLAAAVAAAFTIIVVVVVVVVVVVFVVVVVGGVMVLSLSVVLAAINLAANEIFCRLLATRGDR